MLNIKKSISDIRINKRFLLGLLSSYGLLFLTVIIQFFLIPYFLKILGKSSFGILTIILSLINYAAAGVNWISGGMTRIMGERYAQGDLNSFYNAYSFTKISYTLYSIIGGVLFWLFIPFLKPEIIANEKYFYTVILATVYFVLMYEYNADRIALIVQHKQIQANVLDALGQIIYAILVLLFLYNNFDLPGILLAQFISLCIVRSIVWVYWRFEDKNIHWRIPNREMFSIWKRLKGSMGTHYMLYGALILTLQSESLLLGWLGTPEMVTNYYIIWRIPEIIILLIWRIPGVYTPYLIKMHSLSEYDKLKYAYKKGLQYIVFIAALAGSIYALFGSFLLNLWIGNNAGDITWWIFLLAGLAAFYNSVVKWPAGVAFALVKTKNLLFVVSAELVAKLFLIIILFPKYNYFSPIIATVIVHSLGLFYLYLGLGKIQEA